MTSKAPAPSGPEPRIVPLRAIYERENHSRDEHTELSELADDIAETKWVSPLVVVRDKPKRGEPESFGLVAGYRRFRALWILRNLQRWPWKLEQGEPLVPVQVFENITDAELAAINIAENVRSDPNLAERLQSIHELRHRFGLSSKRVANVVQRSESYVNNCDRAWRELHPEILKALAKGDRRWTLERLFALASKPKDQQLAAWRDERPPLRKRKLRTRAEIVRAHRKLTEEGNRRNRAAVEALAWVLGADAPW